MTLPSADRDLLMLPASYQCKVGREGGGMDFMTITTIALYTYIRTTELYREPKYHIK